MNRKMSFVTTCSLDGWNSYGKRFVASFLENFPDDTTLYLYVDFKTGVKHPRVVIRRISDCHGLDAFQEKIRDMRFATGDSVVHGVHSTAYIPSVIWNARKFSFKVFSVEHAVLNAPDDVVTWIDADCVAFRPIPKSQIEDLIPPYCMLSYLGRNVKYSECGYVSYNRQHPLAESFVFQFAEMYRSGAIFGLKEWHDSYVFDIVRIDFEAHYGVENYSISFNERYADHVFINSVIGRYVDHLKGGRKEKGRSDLKDLVSSQSKQFWLDAR